MLKFYMKQGMVVEKVHEEISFKQCNRLEKSINSNLGNGIKRNMILKKIFKSYWLMLSMERQ